MSITDMENIYQNICRMCGKPFTYIGGEEGKDIVCNCPKKGFSESVEPFQWGLPKQEDVVVDPPSKIVEITMEEMQEKLDQIIEDYDKGDCTHYRIVMPDGRAVMLTPYDGPYTETVKEDENGEMFVELPQRLLYKLGWKEGDDLNMDIGDDGEIYLTKKDETKQEQQTTKG